MMKLVVLSCALAVASAGNFIAPISYAAPFFYNSPLAYSASLAYAAPTNYRGPLSLAPGQPADIIAADGRPLDTLDVNLDRSAHYTAKALKSVGVHVLKKRSAAFLASPFIGPIAYSSPLTYATPLLTPSNYRGPLSLAPGQPANILAADGRPLDTLDVNLDRSAHYTAKALKSVGVHVLKKRSAAFLASPFIGPIAYSSPLTYATPLLTPSNYRGPLSLAPGQPANILAADGRPLDTLDVNLDRSAHFTAKALKSVGVHVLKKRSATFLAPYSTVVAPSPILAHSAPLAYAATPAFATPITTSFVHY